MQEFRQDSLNMKTSKVFLERMKYSTKCMLNVC